MKRFDTVKFNERTIRRGFLKQELNGMEMLFNFQ